jgi:hypothetical protein
MTSAAMSLNVCGALTGLPRICSCSSASRHSRSTTSRDRTPTPSCAIGSKGLISFAVSMGTNANGRVRSLTQTTPGCSCTVCMPAHFP